MSSSFREARSEGGDGFLFRHPGSNYGMVREGMTGATGEIAFRSDERRAARGTNREHVASGPSLDASSDVLPNRQLPRTAARHRCRRGKVPDTLSYIHADCRQAPLP